MTIGTDFANETELLKDVGFLNSRIFGSYYSKISLNFNPEKVETKPMDALKH